MNIFKYGALALIAAASAVLLAPAAEARWAPSGSYQATCRGIRFDGDLLTASCQRRDGSWHNTYLDNADDCDASIVNNNGQLECGYATWRGRGRGRDYDAPRGSYEASCVNIRMDGYTLRATCQRRNGSWRWTELYDAYDCDGRIANTNGQLVCTRRWR
ncbi:MAG: CVNH domain-containing protein [Rhizomicrobium sp.]